MWFSSLFALKSTDNRLSIKRVRRDRADRSIRRKRLVLEPLDDRRLLSANLLLNAPLATPVLDGQKTIVGVGNTAFFSYRRDSR